MAKIKFESTGIVYGYLFDGSLGAYPSKKLHGETKKEIIKQATDGLDGSLDSGMGFDSLKGALLFIKKTTNLTIKGKVFSNTETEEEFVGKLTKKEQDFLIETSYMY